MGLYQQWLDQGENLSPQNANIYWSTYFEAEKEAYRKILGDKETLLTGTVSELADKLGLTKLQMAGFIDGINTSLKNEIDLESLEADTVVTLDIEIEKLFVNMLKAKAQWLYTLDEWNNFLSEERRNEIRKEYNKANTAVSNKIGRNEPCPCGSGLKYKKCCMLKG